MGMSKWIALRVMDAKDKNGLEVAQEKYRLYFVLTDKMHCYKEETDSFLKQEDYEDCIVSEEK